MLQSYNLDCLSFCLYELTMQTTLFAISNWKIILLQSSRAQFQNSRDHMKKKASVFKTRPTDWCLKAQSILGRKCSSLPFPPPCPECICHAMYNFFYLTASTSTYSCPTPNSPLTLYSYWPLTLCSYWHIQGTQPADSALLFLCTKNVKQNNWDTGTRKADAIYDVLYFTSEDDGKYDYKP